MLWNAFLIGAGFGFADMQGTFPPYLGYFLDCWFILARRYSGNAAIQILYGSG
jgi:hypothetical protein